MDYSTVMADNNEALDEIVNEWIADGYEPLGGVAVSPYTWKDEDGTETVSYCFVQALVKRKVKKSSKK